MTLALLDAVAGELEPEERAGVVEDRQLIQRLLALGPNPTPKQIAEWIRDADHR
jgi:hypothetical protein